MKREFNINGIIELLEADGFDGDLKLDTPDLFIKSYKHDIEKEVIELEIIFTASQGNLTQRHSRKYEFDYTVLNQGQRRQIENTYDWSIDNILKKIAKLQGATEIL